MNMETYAAQRLHLTEAEVIEATGCSQPAAQERWFRDRGLMVHRNQRNEVKVALEAYVRWQLGEKPVDKNKREPQLRL